MAKANKERKEQRAMRVSSNGSRDTSNDAFSRSVDSKLDDRLKKLRTKTNEPEEVRPVSGKGI